MKKILFFAVLGALGTSLFTSCSNDDALEVPKSPEVAAADYASAFKAKFGTSTASFNTVKTVTVDAQIPSGKGNYTLRVYDGNPATSQMIGKFENLAAGSNISKKVNCPGDAQNLFFTVEQNGLSKMSNCAVSKTNKVIARFDGGEGAVAALDGTFNLAAKVKDLKGNDDVYAQFSKAFYDNVPSALTTVGELFNETEDHSQKGADAYFFFNEEGQVVFYPVFQNQIFEDEIGYFVYDSEIGEVVAEGVLISNTQEEDLWWRGTATEIKSTCFTKGSPKYSETHPIDGQPFRAYGYSKPLVVNVPQAYADNFSDLLVGITVSNKPYRGTEYLYGEKYYSMSELNAGKTVPNAKVAVYASGSVETKEETPDGITTTTKTFGLVGIEDNLLEGSTDMDMNDIVLFTEATVAQSIVFEHNAHYYVAFEDLGGTYDFDFNDVVLNVEYVSGQTECGVLCEAAGGVLPVEVYYADNQQPLFGGELHSKFGVPVKTVVNTIPAGKNINGIPSAIKDPLVDAISVPEDFTLDIAEDAMPFYIVVNDNNGQRRIDARGDDDTPQAIVIGTTWTKYPDGVDAETQEIIEGQNVTEPAFDTWQWAIECTGIDEAYPDIPAWIADPTVGLGWLKTGVADKLF